MPNSALDQYISYEEALIRCREMIRVGSKSFSLASRVFGPENREAAFLLYGWCRHCDDEIDLSAKLESSRLMDKVMELRSQTRSAYELKSQSHPVFRAFQSVVTRYEIPMHYPLELIEGLAMDAKRDHYPHFSDLLLYCYRVAGTVGLMMSHIMKISHLGALKHASELGIAMQLTNIARDIFEDAEMGRVYLPLEWLEEKKILPHEMTALPHRENLVFLVKRLLDLAEVYYRSGDSGLRFLSVRAACTISAARHVYSEIGNRVKRRGHSAWDTRTWIPLPRKLFVMGVGIFKVLLSFPVRFISPWRSVRISLVWRHS